MIGYTLEFGAGETRPSGFRSWTCAASSSTATPEALWDTTRVPDGLYTLRLRAVMDGEQNDYVDYYVRRIAVSNAPRTLTPVPTALPTPRRRDTLADFHADPRADFALDDGVSAYLYVTQMDQSDPLCIGSQATLRHLDLEREHGPGDQRSGDGHAAVRVWRRDGAIHGRGEYDGEVTVVRDLGTLQPGEARKIEIQVTCRIGSRSAVGS